MDSRKEQSKKNPRMSCRTQAALSCRRAIQVLLSDRPTARATVVGQGTGANPGGGGEVKNNVTILIQSTIQEYSEH